MHKIQHIMCKKKKKKKAGRKKKNCFHLYHTKMFRVFLFFNFILLLNHVPAAAASLFLLLLLPRLLLRFVLAVSSCVCAHLCVCVWARCKSKLIKKFNFLGKFNFAQGKFNLPAFFGALSRGSLSALTHTGGGTYTHTVTKGTGFSDTFCVDFSPSAP